MKGYKAFKKGLVCMGKQYQENTVFEEDEAVICKKGMHFCESPLDVLDYYNLVDGNGDITEFAEVEAPEGAETDDCRKFCTTKLKIGAKLSLSQWIDASVKFLLEKHKANESSGNDAKLASSGNYAQLASSGHYAQLASSGNDASGKQFAADEIFV